MMHESEGSEHHCCCASPQIRLLWAERHKTWLSALLLLKKQGIGLGGCAAGASGLHKHMVNVGHGAGA